MERLLLDTHVVLWALAGDRALGARTRASIVDPRNAVFVSAASAWEIAIKRAIGKLAAPDNVIAAIGESGFSELPITFLHAEVAGALPPHHRDPFDRLLVAQAQVEGLVVVTADAHISRYAVRTRAATR